jgi:transposase
MGNLQPLIPAARPGGRPQEIERRAIVHAIWSVLRSACSWRMMPHDLPNWSTAYWSVRRGKQAGVWEQVHAVLRRDLRVSLGCEPEPSAAILESQSITTRSVRGDERGYDGGKNARQETAPFD